MQRTRTRPAMAVFRGACLAMSTWMEKSIRRHRPKRPHCQEGSLLIVKTTTQGHRKDSSGALSHGNSAIRGWTSGEKRPVSICSAGVHWTPVWSPMDADHRRMTRQGMANSRRQHRPSFRRHSPWEPSSERRQRLLGNRACGQPGTILMTTESPVGGP